MKAPSTLLAGAAALALSLPLWAQNAPPSGGAHTGPHSGPASASHTGAHPGGHGDHAHRAQTMERMKAGQERHLQTLKSKLGLSAEQESAWQTFWAAMTAAPAFAHAQADRAELARLSTPERIERMKAMRSQRQAEMNAHMDRRGEAAKNFYEALQPEQKKIFDEETARRMTHAGGRHGERHGQRHPG